MKLKRLAVGTVIIVSAGVSSVFADTPGPDWMSKEEALQKLSAQGYANAYLKADDGHWEGEATKGGRIYELHVDPRTGMVTKSEPKH
ncbi:PepSY domain-containing protein [Caballeronia sp. INDeC2]|uniref:PepSY domain-containing protein n=1 Tax=Caballeronia sp. INDeC2 TaxID=2921747 RepID=UPI002027F08B|nr:PepSY domain-containing protein [Caballeronia sp. INDeC2]